MHRSLRVLLAALFGPFACKHFRQVASFSAERVINASTRKNKIGAQRTPCFASRTPTRAFDAGAVDNPLSMVNIRERGEPPSGNHLQLFQSVIRPNVQTSPNVWKKLCPGILEESRGVDVKRRWDRDEQVLASPSSVADRVSSSMMAHIDERAQSLQSSERQKMKDSLADSLAAFMSFCNQNLQSEKVVGYSARVVATRGSPSTKCPAWHQDHVPVRWIQSLVGPGCQWVDIHDWTLIDQADSSSNNDEENSSSSASVADVMSESVEEMNRRRVDPNLHEIYQAAPGEAVMLVGRSWSRFYRGSDPALMELPAVVHKSPAGIKPWQGRILLTIDVITADEEEE